MIHPFLFLAEEWNGLDEHLLLLSRYLGGRFELLLLVHPTDGPQTTRLAQRSGMRAIAAPYPPAAGFRTRVAALRALYAQEGVDLLHIHSPAAGGQLATALAARLVGVKGIIATYHQVQPRRLPARSRLLNFVTHAVLVQRTIAVSRGVRDSLARAAGVPPGRVQVVYNGVDPFEAVPGAATAPSGLPPRVAGEVWVGYFGRLSPEKGLTVVLEALARLAREAPDAPTVRAFIVGDGPQRGELEAQARRAAIADRVHFLGFRGEARAIMAELDVVVHAPVYEGFGLVILEAMAAGKPVVINDAPGGPSEIVAAGETGLIVPAGSAEALAGAILRLATDPGERQRLGLAGAAHYRRSFTARHMAEQVAALYEAALGAPSTTPGHNFSSTIA